MSEPHGGMVTGQGSPLNPPSRFVRIRVEEDLEQLACDDESLQRQRPVRTEYFIDNARTVISENDSPDIPFRYSLNPYRGCAHGCAYCYARPTHEYLGLSAGLDFETKILVKQQAPKDQGAGSARYTLLRLPVAVQPVFFAWIQQTQPAKRARVESLVRSTHGGALCETQFGARMRGTGELAAQIRQTFHVFSQRYGLDTEPAPLDVTRFRCPQPTSGQLRLF